jgi:hypothetical protein
VRKPSATAIDLSAFLNDLGLVLDKHFPIGQLCAFDRKKTDRYFLSFLHIDATYILMRGASVIYVGVSGDVGSRLRSHFSNSASDAGREATRFFIMPMDSWDQGAYLEALLINRWRPKYNRTIPPLEYGLCPVLSPSERIHLASLVRAIEAKLGL